MLHAETTTFLLASLLAAAVVGLACSGEDGEGPPERVGHARLVEDLRLDADREDFSVVRRVSVSPLRSIAVPLQQDYAIVLYDSLGARVATVGRAGSGPGEFEHVGPLSWSGDTLFVFDARLRRVTYIGPHGEVLRTRPVPPALQPTALPGIDATFRFFNAAASYPDGSLLGHAYLEVGSDPAGAAPKQVMLVLSATGAARVVATQPWLYDPRWRMTIAGLSKAVPFTFQPATEVAADGSTFGFLTADQTSPDSSTYTVSFFRANGDTMFVRQYAHEGRRIPQAAVDSAIAAMAPRPGRPTEGPADMPKRFQALARERIPPVYAPVQRLTIGLDNTLWIDLAPTAEGQITLVLDDRGERIGTVLVPPSVRIQQANLTHVWATESDADDLASVVRYRVEGLNCRSVRCRR